MLDTGMQAEYVKNGRASALEIKGDVFTAIYVDRRDVLTSRSPRPPCDESDGWARLPMRGALAALVFAWLLRRRARCRANRAGKIDDPAGAAATGGAAALAQRRGVGGTPARSRAEAVVPQRGAGRGHDRGGLQDGPARSQSDQHQDVSRDDHVSGRRRPAAVDAAADQDPRAFAAEADAVRLRAAASRVPERADEKHRVRRPADAQTRRPLPRQRHLRAVRAARACGLSDLQSADAAIVSIAAREDDLRRREERPRGRQPLRALHRGRRRRRAAARRTDQGSEGDPVPPHRIPKR